MGVIPLESLVAFTLVAIPIILVPGPSVLFVIGRSLSLGRVGGLISVLGNAAGGFVAAVAVAFGVGVIIAQSVVLFTVVKVAGALYLIYLGVQAIRHRKQGSMDATATTTPTPPRSTVRLLAQGFIVGVTNPKTIVFFIAVLPQFVNYPAGNIPLQMLILGTVFMIMAVISDGAWALLAGVARDWFGRSPRRIEALSATGGVLMIGLGVGSLFVGNKAAA